MEKQFRPPIVCVLGHVDHGKTTLLDAIRKTNVAGKEAGGITQSIGASQITTKEGKKITFIDTPGHAAFTKMRGRGANVADIGILVVDASDGVKPQTLEALKLLKETKIPFIVAATKIDLPSASVETVKGQLEKEAVAFEGRGGDVPIVSVSAKKGTGIDELLETISLVAEVHEIKGDKNSPLEAVVIETSKDKKGPLANAIVQEGTLRVGETINAEDVSCKVKALFNEKGEPVREVVPSEAVSILGFDRLPEVGAKIHTTDKEPTEEGPERQTAKIGKIKEGQIPIIIRAQNAGSLEAILASLPSGIVVIDSKVGGVNESDILLAKADKAHIIAFESKVSGPVLKLAEEEGVGVATFDVIYELFQALEELVKAGTTKILGKAVIVATFPYNEKKVAGCKVVEGKIAKDDNLILARGDKELGKVKAVSLKKQKQEINEAKVGEEFGVIFEPQLDFEIGDMLLSVAK